jgi:hypothetical protein
MQPDQTEPPAVPPPTPSESSSPAHHPLAPTTSYDAPTLRAPARIHPLRVAAVLVVTGLTLNILLDLADTVLSPWAKSEALRGTVAADDPLIVLTQSLAWLQVGAFVATGVAFITWLYLARKNLDTWRIRGLRWGPGWAIRAWILPLANLVLPAVVMTTVVRGSRTPPDETEAPPGRSALVWSWWLIYLCAAVGGTVFVSRDFNATDSAADIAGYNAAGTVPSIVAAVLAIVLVRRISGQQSRRHAALSHRPEYPRA